jgi:FMN-dependent NADH-azoreductase
VAASYVAAWTAARPGSRVVERDLAKTPPTFVTEPWIEGAFGPADARSPQAHAAMAESDLVVNEVLAATEILIVAPIYNFGAPAVLKAWIDQLVRFGRTFTVNASGYAGLVPPRPVRVISASGSDFTPTGPYWSINFLEPQLRAALGFIGLADVTFVYVPNQSADEATASAAKDAAVAKAVSLAAL